MATTAIVLQARMGSRRLPGKVLARLRGATILERCIQRLRTSAIPIVVATTTNAEDDAVEREAKRLRVETFRGSENDVLARYVGAAHFFGLRTIIRATADNPFVDAEGPSRILPVADRANADHIVEGGLPVGAAVELVTLDALERSQPLISDPYDREHVTSFIRRDSRFRSLRVVAPRDARQPGLRLTVDTPDDFAFATALATAVGDADPPVRLATIIGVASDLQRRAQATTTERKRGA